MRNLTTAVLLTALMISGRAPLMAQTPVEQLVLEFRGQAEAVQRTDAELQKAFDEVVSALVPKLGGATNADSASVNALQAIGFRVGRPGAGRERVALCRAMLRHLTPATPESARVWLLLQLEFIGGEECVGTMATLLEDKSPVIRERALRVLQEVASPSAAVPLRKALERAESPAWRIAVAGALGFRGDAGSVPLLGKLLSDADAAVVAAAADALGTIGTAQADAALAAAKVPSGMQATVDDARARCAAALSAQGQTRQAEAIYAALAPEGRSPRTRGLGITGLVSVRSAQALPQLLSCLEAPDATLQRTAAGLCASVRDESATGKLLALYPKLPLPTQVVLLESLAARGDKAALPVVLDGLKSEDAALRGTAIRAAGCLGDGRVVPSLVEIAVKGERGDKQAASDCLVSLRGADVEQALLKLAQEGEPGVRAAAMSVMVDRKDPEAARLLLQAAQGTDARLAADALKTLGRVAGPRDYDALLKLMLGAKDAGVRQAALEAMAVASRRQRNPDVVVGPAVAALPGASVENQCALIELLAMIGGDKGLAEVAKAARATDPEVKRTAVEALADSCDDPKALPTLLEIAKGDADRVLRIQALRGYLRIAGQNQDRPEEMVTRLGEALTVAQRPEEKRQVLGALGGLRVPAAVELAAKCLADPVTAAEASNAIFYLTAPQKRGNDTLRAVRGPAATAALTAVMRQRGQELPEPWKSQDVGAVGAAGWGAHTDGKFTLSGCGSDIWGKADAFHFVCRPLVGDGSISARVVSLGETDEWAKAGVMIRDGLEGEAMHAFTCVTPKQSASMQRRPKTGGESETVSPGKGIKAPYWVKLVRAGNLFTSFVSADGTQWTKVHEQQIPMRKEAWVGMAVCSHSDRVSTQAVIDNVQVTPGQ